MANDTRPVDDHEIVTLATLESHAFAVIDTASAAETIADALDYLHSTGAHASVLDDIHASASSLVESIQQLDETFRDTMAIARSFREQREMVREEYEEFRAAVHDVDTSVPEVENLWQQIEESNMEWLSYSLFDEWEKIVEELINVTPLDEHQARDLVNVLGSQDLHGDHVLWIELIEWVERAKQAIEDGDL